MPKSSSSDEETEPVAVTSDEESIYKSVSSGLGEKIEEEIERLQDLSMEVIPLEMIHS